MHHENVHVNGSAVCWGARPSGCSRRRKFVLAGASATRYIQEHFGIPYTQDESYYILDNREGSQLYLGLREGVRLEEMSAALEAAQTGNAPFCAECYVNLWPTRKDDHFSIPAGTIHCSGKDNLVLEISATPYIFSRSSCGTGGDWV